MVKLRSKLHLSRQRRKSSLSRASCSSFLLLDECNATVPTRTAGSRQTEPDIRRDHSNYYSSKPASAVPNRRAITLDKLPDELLARIASFCEFGDVVRLRRSSQTLRLIFGKSSTLEQYLRRLMDVFPTNGTLSRDVLIDMIKSQLADEFQDEDTRQDIFLCLAVSIPATQQVVLRKALVPLLARAQTRGFSRDVSPEDDPHVLLSNDLQTHINNLDISTQLERRIGVASTLIVMGCPNVCNIDIGKSLVAVNIWSTRSAIWSEKTLLKKKHINLQLAFSMVAGLLYPSDWTTELQSTTSTAYRDLASRVRADFRGEELTSASQSFWLSWEGLQTRSLQLAGLIAYVLRISGFEDVPRSDLLPFLRPPPSPLSSSSSSSSSSPPQANDPENGIPGTTTNTPNPSSGPISRLKVPLLENFGDDGIRPQSNSWQEWYTSRVRDLVESIEDEEWYGYYVYTLDSTDNLNPLGSRDPAMENIYFKLGSSGATTTTTGRRESSAHVPSSPPPRTSNNNNTPPPPHPSPPKKLRLEAQGGKDGVTGEFDFFGTVANNTGHVTLRKTYKGAHYWDYEGVMTPVGIVGEWGREGTGYNGYFWLWKRSWMAGDAVQRTYAYS